MLVCVFFKCALHTRPRVQRAPGLPCALLLRRDRIHANLGRNRAARSRTHTQSSSPAKAGDPVFQSARVHHRRSGILDRPVKPDDDEWIYVLVLATAFRPSFSNSFAPLKERAHATLKRGRMRPSREGAGKTGCSPHPRSRVQWVTKQNAHEHTGEAEAVRPSLRNGFTACFVLSLVSTLCHHRRRDA